MDISAGSVILILLLLLVSQHASFRSQISTVAKLIRDISVRKKPITFVRFGPKCLREAISDLEIVEETLRELERRCIQEDFNLRAILSGMTEGIFVTNADGIIILANSQLTNLLQLNSEPLHKGVHEALGNHQINEAVKQTLQKRVPGRWEITVRRGVDPTATFTYLALNLAPITNPIGEFSGVVGVLHDITALKQMENLQKEFVSNTSHELRTPLAIFRGYLEEMLEAPPGSKEELLHILRQLLKQTERLQALVQDLLTLSQFESRTITLNKQPISLSTLIEETTDEFQQISRAHPCTIKLRSSLLPDEDLVYADENRIKQVICNILDNSLKYSSSNCIVIISLRPSSCGNMLECSIADNGIGIPEKDQPFIFERFYRADKSRVHSTGGTGLGLCIVKQIIEAHGGFVKVDSQLNVGTTITFSLPRAQRNMQMQTTINQKPAALTLSSEKLASEYNSMVTRIA